MFQIIHYTFLAYTLMLVVRILGSWVPELASQPWMLFIGQFTDPYLNFFRKIIPPIGGILDLSPILAFLALQFLESFLKALFR
jgi:YggT family protein